MLLYRSLQLQRQNINQSVNPRPYRASYGVSLVKIFKKIDRVITAPHCIYIYIYMKEEYAYG